MVRSPMSRTGQRRRHQMDDHSRTVQELCLDHMDLAICQYYIKIENIIMVAKKTEKEKKNKCDVSILTLRSPCQLDRDLAGRILR